MTSSAPPAPAGRGLWTPETAELATELARATPAGLAYVHGGAFDPDRPGQWIPAEHLLLIAARIVAMVARIEDVQQRILSGELPPETQGPRLMVFMPPRHGKSELISKYTPAWFLGTHPDLRMILCGYGSSFASTWGRKGRDLLEQVGSDIYGVQVDPRSKAADMWDLDGRRGGMITAGVGGRITGFGAHLLIVDDPVKDAAEAASEVMQEKTWDWWTGTARTRLMSGAGVIVLQTRWHELDLSGRLLADDPTRDEQGKKLTAGERRDDVGGEEWDVLCLPALALEDGTDGYGQPDELARGGDWIERPDKGPTLVPTLGSKTPGARMEWHGEALFPELYPEGQLRRITSSRYVFSSQYQQTPTPAEGGIFKRADMRYFKVDPARDMYVLYTENSRTAAQGIDPASAFDVGRGYVYRFMTADLAFSSKETADFTVLGHWAVTPDKDLLLLDVERVHFETEDLPGVITAFCETHQIKDMRVESAAYGTKVITNLVREGLPVRSLEADTDKVTRAISAVPRYEQHTVYHRLGAPWLEKYERELLSFPNGANDDQVDVFSYAALALPGISFARARQADGHRTETGGLRSQEL